MDWNGKNVFVTGAGGFIGSHLTEALVEKGANVRALVRYSSTGGRGWLDTIPRDTYGEIEFVAGDLRDAEAMVRAVADRDYVFHLGALISIPYSYVGARDVVEVNVMGTLNMLNACRASSRVQKMVHTSTSEVYGTAQYVPIDEKHPLQGQSPYSASKIGADKIVESFANSFELPALTVRPFNTYGPRQSARAVIPAIIVQLLAGQELNLGSLTPTRDFTYVSDTVAGFLCAADSDVRGVVVNLGTGNEIAIGDLVKLIGEVLGVDPRIQTDEQRIRPEKSEVQRLLSDNSLAAELIKWRPEVSLREGLTRSAEWLREHQDRYMRARTDYII